MKYRLVLRYLKFDHRLLHLTFFQFSNHSHFNPIKNVLQNYIVVLTRVGFVNGGGGKAFKREEYCRLKTVSTVSFD
jgi:hypothetical protein